HVIVLDNELPRHGAVFQDYLLDRGTAERGFPNVCPEGEPRKGGEGRGPVQTDRDRRFATSTRQQQRRVRERDRGARPHRPRGAHRRAEHAESGCHHKQRNETVPHPTPSSGLVRRREVTVKYLSRRPEHRWNRTVRYQE